MVGLDFLLDRRYVSVATFTIFILFFLSYINHLEKMACKLEWSLYGHSTGI
jgi:hypothetical protein